MKKLMAVVLSAVILGAMALPAAAQGRRWNNANQTYSERTNRYPNWNNRTVYNYDRQQQARAYYDNGAYDNRSFWDKHRDKLTAGIGVLGGALLGRAIGGGRGTAIGALAGGAGAALYTYKLRNNRWR